MVFMCILCMSKQQELKQKYKMEQESLYNNEFPIDPSVCENCCGNDTYFVQKLNGVSQECRDCQEHMKLISQKNRR